jgi:hypothetical protein
MYDGDIDFYTLRFIRSEQDATVRFLLKQADAWIVANEADDEEIQIDSLITCYGKSATYRSLERLAEDGADTEEFSKGLLGSIGRALRPGGRGSRTRRRTAAMRPDGDPRFVRDGNNNGRLWDGTPFEIPDPTPGGRRGGIPGDGLERDIRRAKPNRDARSGRPDADGPPPSRYRGVAKPTRDMFRSDSDFRDALVQYEDERAAWRLGEERKKPRKPRTPDPEGPPPPSRIGKYVPREEPEPPPQFRIKPKPTRDMFRSDDDYQVALTQWGEESLQRTIDYNDWRATHYPDGTPRPRVAPRDEKLRGSAPPSRVGRPDPESPPPSRRSGGLARPAGRDKLGEIRDLEERLAQRERDRERDREREQRAAERSQRSFVDMSSDRQMVPYGTAPWFDPKPREAARRRRELDRRDREREFVDLDVERRRLVKERQARQRRGESVEALNSEIDAIEKRQMQLQSTTNREREGFGLARPDGGDDEDLLGAPPSRYLGRPEPMRQMFRSDADFRAARNDWWENDRFPYLEREERKKPRKPRTPDPEGPPPPSRVPPPPKRTGEFTREARKETALNDAAERLGISREELDSWSKRNGYDEYMDREHADLSPREMTDRIVDDYESSIGADFNSEESSIGAEFDPEAARRFSEASRRKRTGAKKTKPSEVKEPKESALDDAAERLGLTREELDSRIEDIRVETEGTYGSMDSTTGAYDERTVEVPLSMDLFGGVVPEDWNEGETTVQGRFDVMRTDADRAELTDAVVEAIKEDEKESVAKAAERLGISESTLRSWMSRENWRPPSGNFGAALATAYQKATKK